MRCTSMKLSQRTDQDNNKRIPNQHYELIPEPVYITNENNWYSLTTSRKSSNHPPKLSVKNLEFPEDFDSYNSGYSMDKWARKAPLKSKKCSQRKKNFEDFEEDSDTCDISNIIQNLDEIFKEEGKEESYEIRPEIEELIRQSQEFEEIRKSSKKKLKKLKKKIKFSLSKPASPETEQVIRVDVTSSVCLDELKFIESRQASCRETDEDLSKKFESLCKEDGNCIIKCSQLMLTPR